MADGAAKPEPDLTGLAVGSRIVSADVSRATGYAIHLLAAGEGNVGLLARLSPTRGARRATALALEQASRWEQARDRDAAPDATVVSALPGVYSRASALAREVREDRAAVDELRALAGADHEVLAQAERLSRIAGKHRESELDDRRQRLVAAALGDRDVVASTDEDSARFKALGEFVALPRATQWQRLAAAEPRLAEVETDARAGAFRRSEPREIDGLPRPELRQRKAENARRWFALHERINQLIGPASSNVDRLLASRTARDAAFAYLDTINDNPPG